MAPEVLRPGEMKTVISLQSPVVKTPLGTGGCLLLTRELSKHALCTSHGSPARSGYVGAPQGRQRAHGAVSERRTFLTNKSKPRTQYMFFPGIHCKQTSLTMNWADFYLDSSFPANPINNIILHALKALSQKEAVTIFQ